MCVNKEGKSDSNRLSSVIAVSLGRCWLHELWWPLIHDLPDSPYFMSCFKMVTKSSYINAIRCACRISSEGSHLSELLEPVFPFSQNRLATVIKNCSVLMGKWLFRCIFFNFVLINKKDWSIFWFVKFIFLSKDQWAASGSSELIIACGKWCNDTFIQICSKEETNTSLYWMALGVSWPCSSLFIVCSAFSLLPTVFRL